MGGESGVDRTSGGGEARQRLGHGRRERLDLLGARERLEVELSPGALLGPQAQAALAGSHAVGGSVLGCRHDDHLVGQGQAGECHHHSVFDGEPGVARPEYELAPRLVGDAAGESTCQGGEGDTAVSEGVGGGG